MDVDENPVAQGLSEGDAVNDAGMGKEKELTVLAAEEKEGKVVEVEEREMEMQDEEEEDEFFDGRSGSLDPVNDGTDTLPSDVHMGESRAIPQEIDDGVTETIVNADSMAGLDGKPESLSIVATNDDVKAEEEVPEQVTPEEITTLKAEARNTEYSNNWLIDTQMGAADVSGTIEEQAAFMKELERFYKERAFDFKPPKFYGEPLNCLKLWRLVIMLGGYDHVTTNKYWRQIGESFHPPKTCTTISWTFRIFYEKALLEYERHEVQAGLQLTVDSMPMQTIADKESNAAVIVRELFVLELFDSPFEQCCNNTGQAVGSHKGWRDSSSQAVKGQRNAERGEDLSSTPKREKNLRSIGLVKQKNSANHGHMDKDGHSEADKSMVTTVVDVGPPADWVKVNVQENPDCFEIYALVPGLLREEVRVQSDPAGRLVITGQPEQLENPWGITPFKKVVNLPVRIDPRQTSAVVSLHGRLYVRVPFERGSLTNL